MIGSAMLPPHPQNTGTSLVETFDEQTIHSHVELIRTAAAQLKLSNPPPLNPDDACRVCHQTKLTFEPPSLWCTHCGVRIKRGQVFYCTPVEYEIKGAWCHSCCNQHQADRIPFEGSQVRPRAWPTYTDLQWRDGWPSPYSCTLHLIDRLLGLFVPVPGTVLLHVHACPHPAGQHVSEFAGLPADGLGPQGGAHQEEE